VRLSYEIKPAFPRKMVALTLVFLAASLPLIFILPIQSQQDAAPMIFPISGGGQQVQHPRAGSGVTFSIMLSDVREVQSMLTRDNGIVASGYDGHGWVGKIDSHGTLEWSKDYRPSLKARSIEQTEDGGYVVAGDTILNGTEDGWVLKLDQSGDVQWSRTIGSSSGQGLVSVSQTSDRGYIAAGTVLGFRGPYDWSDGWLVKFDSSGNVEWQQAYGGSGFSNAYSVQETRDHGFVVAGNTPVNNTMTAWLFKTDRVGRIVWQKAYAVTNDNHAGMVEQTSDGGYILDADVTSTDISPRPVSTLFLKLDSEGNIQWQKLYSSNGVGDINPGSIEETRDGGFIASGRSAKFYALGPGVNGTFNGISGAWLLKLDKSGNLVWQRTYGNGVNDAFNHAEETPTGGFFVGGNFFSLGGPVFLKTDNQGNIPGCEIEGLLENITLRSNFNISVTSRTGMSGVNIGANILNELTTAYSTSVQAQVQCSIEAGQSGDAHRKITITIVPSRTIDNPLVLQRRQLDNTHS